MNMIVPNLPKIREAIAESDEINRIETISKENRDRDSGRELMLAKSRDLVILSWISMINVNLSKEAVVDH
jgi:hypothetical protein